MSTIPLLKTVFRGWRFLHPSLRLSLVFGVAAGVVAVLEMFGVIRYPSKEIEIISPRPGVLSQGPAADNAEGPLLLRIPRPLKFSAGCPILTTSDGQVLASYNSYGSL